MQTRHRRPDQRSSRPRTWAIHRRQQLAEAEAALRQAGRALELVPADPDVARMAGWCFRWAARCRAEQEAAAA